MTYQAHLSRYQVETASTQFQTPDIKKQNIYTKNMLKKIYPVNFSKKVYYKSNISLTPNNKYLTFVLFRVII